VGGLDGFGQSPNMSVEIVDSYAVPHVLLLRIDASYLLCLKAAPSSGNPATNQTVP
jgi:hypothetical protein